MRDRDGQPPGEATRHGSTFFSENEILLGIRADLNQCLLLVPLNAFVSGKVGLERTVVPLIGSEAFHLASASLVTGFIVRFGVAKSLTNLVSGQIPETWAASARWSLVG